MKSLTLKYISTYKGLPGNCWRGLTLSLLESCLMGIFYFLSVYFINDLHLDVTTTSNIIACYGIGAVLGGYISGRLSDKISPLKISAFSLIIQSAGYFFLTIHHNIFLLAVNVFMLGIAAYGFITSNHLWILNQCNDNESQKLKAINLLSTASNLGLGLSGMYIGYLARFGFERIFYMTSVAVMLLSIYLLFFEADPIKSKLSTRRVKNTRDESNTTEPAILWFVLLSVFLVGSVVSQLSSTYPIYIQSTFPKLGIQAVSILFTLNSLLVVFFSTPIGNYIEKFNKILILGIGGFLIGIGMLALSFSVFFITAIIACTVYTLGEIIFFSIAQLLCYQSSHENSRGNGIGLFRTTYAASRIAGPAAGGYIYHMFGGTMVWYISGLIGILCLIWANHLKSNLAQAPILTTA